MNDYAKDQLNYNKNLINENNRRNDVLAGREMDDMEPRMLDDVNPNLARLDNSGRVDMELDGGKRRNTRRFRRNRRSKRNRRLSRRR